MTWQGFAQFFVILAFVLLLAPPVGLYLKMVYNRKNLAWDYLYHFTASVWIFCDERNECFAAELKS